MPDSQCGFRLINLEAWSKLRIRANHFEIESETLLAFIRAGYQVEFVPIRVIYKKEQSKIHPVWDTLRWFKWWIRARIGLYMSGARSVVRPPHNTVAPQDASLDGPPEFSDGEGGGDTWAETLEDETDSPETLALGRVQDAQVREAVNYFRYRLRPMEFDIAASRFRGDYSDGLEAVGKPLPPRGALQ